MPENKDYEIAGFAEGIKRYLDKCPDAADTLEGIIHWWLLRERYELTRARVEKSIKQLLEDGEIEQSTLRGGRIIYRKAKDRDTSGQ